MPATKVSRRAFLQGLLPVVASTVLAGCVPKIVKETVIVEGAPKVVKETVIVEGAPKVVKETVIVEGAPKVVKETVIVEGAPKVAPAEKIKLLVWTHDVSIQIEYTKGLIKQFTEKMPNVEIEYTQLPSADMQRQLVIAMAAGTGPDVFNSEDSVYPMWASKGLVAPLDPVGFGKNSIAEVVELYHESALTQLWDKDRNVLYGIPIEWAVLSLFYHVPTFKEVGLDPTAPPQDWVTLTEMAQKLTKRDAQGNIIRPGFQQWYGSDPGWPLFTPHAMMVQRGAGVLSPDGKECIINEPEAIEAVQLLTDWTTKYKVSQPGWAIPGQAGGPFGEFIGGSRPFWVIGPFLPPILQMLDPKFVYKEDWDIAPFPQWPAGINKREATHCWRWALFMSARCRHKTEASALIAEWGGDWKGILKVKGDIPSVKGWENDPSIVGKPWMATVMKDLQRGVPIFATPQFQEIGSQAAEMIERVYAGQSVKAAADEAKQKIDAILKAK